MRIATYYLENDREVDVYLKDNHYIAQDAYLKESWQFGKKQPTWLEVSAKWKEIELMEK